MEDFLPRVSIAPIDLVSPYPKRRNCGLLIIFYN
jgi:hypothetical protein